MPIAVKRRDGESSENLLRRFSKVIQQAHLVNTVKDNQVYSKPAKPNAKRKSAIHRAKTRTKLEYLDRVGKLEEYLAKQPKRRRRR